MYLLDLMFMDRLVSDDIVNLIINKPHETGWEIFYMGSFGSNRKIRKEVIPIL